MRSWEIAKFPDKVCWGDEAFSWKSVIDDDLSK